MASSLIRSRCFIKARSELPWATIRIRAPSRSRGTMVSFQYGSTRASTSLRLSPRGSSAAPTGEEVELVPLAFAVTEKYELIIRVRHIVAGFLASLVDQVMGGYGGRCNSLVEPRCA